LHLFLAHEQSEKIAIQDYISSFADFAHCVKN